MQTGEGPGGPGAGEGKDDRRDQRDAQRIGIGGADDQIARIQLAARWSESFAPEGGDSQTSKLKRFRVADDNQDSVTHGVEPAELQPDHANSSASVPTSAPQASEPAPPASEPQTEPRPW
jgi:hypothetical protein